MKISRNTDIIRQGSRNFVNVNSKNRLIARLVSATAENVYAFRVPFGGFVDQETQEQMSNTYWVGVQHIPNSEIDETVQIVEL